MDALFSFKNTYTVNDSIENVSAQIKSIAEKRWYDFSKNITGKVKEDGSFKLTPKWTFGYASGFDGSDLTYLFGKLTAENNKTIIKINTRPNYAGVFFFYFLILLLILKIAGFNILPDVKLVYMICLAPLFCFILALVMIFGVIRLRIRFERLMELTGK